MNSISIQQTETYRQVFAWLRGGDATPDPQMENSFLDLITAAVAERLIANRKEYERMVRAAERAERRSRRPAGCLSIKAMLEEVRKDAPLQMASALADDDDLPEADPISIKQAQQVSIEPLNASACELALSVFKQNNAISKSEVSSKP